MARKYADTGDRPRAPSGRAQRPQRQRLARPLWNELRQWLDLARRMVAEGSATAKAINYALGTLERAHAPPRGRRRGG